MRTLMFPSWKLWRTLREPPLIAHAVYRRVVAVPPFGLPFGPETGGRLVSLLIGLIALYLVVRHGVISLVLMLFVVPAIGVLFFLLMPVLLPPFTLFVGGFWAASISGSVIREHNAHTYDLLCLAPSGSLAANWAIASGCLHRGDVFGALRFAMVVALTIGGLFLGLLAMVAVFLALRASPAATLVIALRTVTDLTIVLVIFYIHYVQSMVLSALVGVLVPTLFQHRQDSPWLAFALFTAIQVGSYALFALFHVLVSPVFERIEPTDWIAYVSVPVIYCLVFLLSREGIVLWLWHSINARLNTHPAEQQRLIRSMV